MSNSYFRLVPDFEYVSRTADAKNISEYMTVKNLFKRAKIRDDIFNDATAFTQYKIIGDDRPDNVAFDVYEDSSLDWLILLSNNIINIQTEWPMTQQSFDNYLLNKYGTYDSIYSVHHYETKLILNSGGIPMLRPGIQVSADYTLEYFDVYSEQNITVNDTTTPVTNYEYEEKIQDNLRNISVLKSEYLTEVFNDMEDIMPYKEGSTQYVSETLKKGDNIRLYQ